MSMPLFVIRSEAPDSGHGFGGPSGFQSVVLKTEKFKFLRVLYLEVEKCKGYVAQEKMFSRDCLVHGAWVGGSHAWQRALVTLSSFNAMAFWPEYEHRPPL